MLTVARLRRKPRYFHNFTGLTPEQFDTLLAAVQPVYAARERAQKTRPQRQRAIGGGHPFHLGVPERLLMTLLYLRHYLTQPLLGYLFGLDESSVSRERNHRMVPVLRDVLPVPVREELGLVHGSKESRTQKIGTLEKLPLDSQAQNRPRKRANSTLASPIFRCRIQRAYGTDQGRVRLQLWEYLLVQRLFGPAPRRPLSGRDHGPSTRKRVPAPAGTLTHADDVFPARPQHPERPQLQPSRPCDA